MYIPGTNREERLEVLGEFIRAHPFAALVSSGPEGELWATHLPVVFDATSGEHGRIEGHMARANPHHRLIQATAEGARQARESLLIFSGPEAYITPTWYPTKAEDGRAVPTWNYIAVHAYGVLTLHHDPEWLLGHVTRLSEQSELARGTEWAVSDAPQEYVARELKAIVGFEMQVSRIEGRWKMSQNQPARNIDGVVEGLKASGDEDDRVVAEIVKERRPKR